MATNQNRPQQPSNIPINEKMLGQMLEAQMLKAKNESRELDIRSKEVDHQATYANNVLKTQAELLKSKPAENRKTMKTLAYIVLGFVTLFVILVIACLYLNKDAFLLTLLKGLGYLVTTLAGYWAGKKSTDDKATVTEANPEQS